jgi:DNA polymerase
MFAQAGITAIPQTGISPAADRSTPDHEADAQSLDRLWEQWLVADGDPAPDLAQPSAADRPTPPRPAVHNPPAAEQTPTQRVNPEAAETGPAADRSRRGLTEQVAAQVAALAAEPAAARAAPLAAAKDAVPAATQAVVPTPIERSPGHFGPDLSLLPDLPDPQRTVELSLLADQVRTCQRCPELVKHRTQTVFGTGNLRPRLVLMGEAPGADEDRLGEPMVGASGQLLNKIIAAMKMSREDVYILNAAKCRPPQNRNPTDGECANCRPYWDRQLEILRPEVIVCLGAVASKTLLQTNAYVGQLRGTIHDYRGAKVVVTYHPSYLLRTESAKRQTWDDMKTVMRLLNIPL